LGGHDHCSAFEEIGNVTLIKSGTDFEEFSDIAVNIASKKVTSEKVVITDKFQPDSKMTKFV
jgi:hypothetical protein